MAHFVQPAKRPLRNPLRQKLSESGLDAAYGGAAGRHPGQPTNSVFGTLAAWTDVPPFGTKDPHATTTLQRRHLYQKSTGEESDAAGLAHGRAKTQPITPFVRAFPGKRTWGDTPDRGERSLPYLRAEAAHSEGVRKLKASDVALSADPNHLTTIHRPSRPRGVRMSELAARVEGVFEPQRGGRGFESPSNSVGRASGSRLARGGGVRILRDRDGVPTRAKEMPVAWPAWPGYPPDKDGGGCALDYALAQHGAGGTFRVKAGEHPDVREKRERQRAAEERKRVQQGTMCYRHAGERYY